MDDFWLLLGFFMFWPITFPIGICLFAASEYNEKQAQNAYYEKYPFMKK